MSTEQQNPSQNGAEPAAAPADEIETLRAELAGAQAKAAEHWNQYLRASAEMENIRKRAERDAAASRKYGVERLAADLLGVRDSLELGLAAAQSESAAGSLVAGLELTLKQLTDVLERHGVQAIDPTGQAFDPALHQAMAMQETAGQAPNTVIQVLQKGYRLHDRLLRPAMVLVAKAPAAGAGAEAAGEAPPGCP